MSRRAAWWSAVALSVAIATGCGGNGEEPGSSKVLSATGYANVRIAGSIHAIQKASPFPINLDHGVFAPCRSFDVSGRSVYGMAISDRIVVVGTRDKEPPTDKGLRVGMTLASAKHRYGEPSHVAQAPYDPGGGDVLWRIGRAGGKAVYLRAITSETGHITVLEVGQQPEIEAEEGCV